MLATKPAGLSVMTAETWWKETTNSSSAPPTSTHVSWYVSAHRQGGGKRKGLAGGVGCFKETVTGQYNQSGIWVTEMRLDKQVPGHIGPWGIGMDM